jgi:hypothetical protein
MKVNLPNGKNKSLPVYEGQQPFELAEYFCRLNGIDNVQKRDKLTNLIEQKIHESRESEVN